MKPIDKPYKLAKVCEGANEWYVYYHYLNHHTGKFKMFKDRGGINYYKNIKERRTQAQGLADAYNERLKGGWNPLGDANIGMDDLTQNHKYIPLLQVFRIYNQSKEKVVSKSTIDQNSYVIRTLERWLKIQSKADIALPFFTALHGRTYSDWLKNSGRSGKTHNNHIKCLRTLFNMAVERELIDKNPLLGVKELKEDDGKHFPFTDKQKQKLKECIQTNRPELWMYVKFIYHTYVRPVELTRIRVSHLNMHTWEMIVHSSNGKNRKQLSVTIPESFRAEVQAMELEKYPADWFIFGQGFKPHEKPMDRKSATMRHSAMLKKCGMGPEHSLYGWKHTGNVDAFLAGIDIYDLMRQNRHSSLEQTMKYLRSMGLRPNVGFSSKAPAL